jgi:serine protease Do
VEIREVTPDKAKDLKLSSPGGVIVTEVEPDSPAAKAGLKENDVITQYHGQTVEGTVQFRRLVRETPPGRTVALVITRDGASQNLSVELGDRDALFENQVKAMQWKMRDLGNVHSFVKPDFDLNFSGPNEFFDARTPVLGISVEDLSGQLGAYFGAPDGKGILVREVRPGTPAEKAGLKAGDVIVKLDGKPIHNLAELREQLRADSDQKALSVTVLRRGSEMSIPVTIEKPHPPEPLHAFHQAQL